MKAFCGIQLFEPIRTRRFLLYQGIDTLAVSGFQRSVCTLAIARINGQLCDPLNIEDAATEFRPRREETEARKD
jgi:hypothetical protein